MTKAKDTELIEVAERLVKKMVRDASKKIPVRDAAGNHMVGPNGKKLWRSASVMDRARALDGALKLLQLKHKITPDEQEEGAFERAQRRYHGVPEHDERGGEAASSEATVTDIRRRNPTAA